MTIEELPPLPADLEMPFPIAWLPVRAQTYWWHLVRRQPGHCFVTTMHADDRHLINRIVQKHAPDGEFGELFLSESEFKGVEWGVFYSTTNGFRTVRPISVFERPAGWED